MTDCNSCQNGALIRKQREELILLTNELQNQEHQINTLHASNLKLKETIKLKEKRETELEKKNRTLNAELTSLNEKLKLKAEELDSITQKLATKDAYIQSQSNRIFQLQTANEKSTQEINNVLKNKAETKLENSKLQSKIKDQSNRILQLKEQNTEIVKILETRNNLIKTSSDHIKVLESNLLQFINLTKTVKKTNEISTDINQFDLTSSKQDEPSCTKVSSSSIQKHLYLNSKEANELLSALQDLKETWLESNLKYEEVKNLVSCKLVKDSSTLIIKDNEPAVDLDNISRIFTSSPIPP